MATALAIIGKSLRMIGVLSSGDAGTAAEYQDGLDSLNSVIDGWSVDPKFYFCEQDEVFALSAKSNYCIGNASVPIVSLTSSGAVATATTAIAHSLETGNKVSVSGANEAPYNVTAQVTVTGPFSFTYPIAGAASPATGQPACTAGDFLTARPLRILGAFTRQGLVDTPVAIITEAYWTNIANKTATAPVPARLLYRTNHPFGQVAVNPIPTGAAMLHLKSEKVIAKFTDLTTDNPLPPGYQRLLELALAVDLSTEYGTKVSEAVVISIKASYQSLLDNNMSKLKSSKVEAGNGNGA